MTEPCQQIERIVKSETVVGVVLDSLDGLHKKVDGLADDLSVLKGKQDSYEKRPYSNSFVGGVAAAGGLVGLLLWDFLKPFAKPIAAILVAAFK